MITLRTGLPGSGKTLRTIALAIEEVKAGREVFALNVNGLDYEATGIKRPPFDHVRDWQKLPKGARLIVDEIQDFLPPRHVSAPLPDWVAALTRNRHYGIDLDFITQGPKLIDYFVRELVNYHEHLVRLEGNFAKARVFFREGPMEIPKDGGPPKGASFNLWTYPKVVYDLYKSAEQHTPKRYIPQRLKFVVIGGFFVLAMLAAGAYIMAGSLMSKEAEAPAAPVSQSFETSRVSDVDRLIANVGGKSETRAAWSTAQEYAELHTPLIDGMPWTARVYAGDSPASEPEIYCMSSEAKCTCLTEQGTRMYTSDAVCRSIARDGVYNPYRRAQEHNSPASVVGPTGLGG